MYFSFNLRYYQYFTS